MINYDHANYDCCTISTAAHVSESLGNPIKLPPTLADKLADSWVCEWEDDLLALFELIMGEQYEQKHRDNTYNGETDLDSHLVYTVWAPVGCADWCWAGDTFVSCEVSSAGDPRYGAYTLTGIYRVDSIADTGFLDFVLGWWLEPISGESCPTLDRLNDHLSIGYSSNPTYELGELCVTAPVWSERLQSYVCRPKGLPYACKVSPFAPHYGG